MAKPCLPNWDLLVSMGYNPKTNSFDNLPECQAKSGIKRLLRIIDEQDAVNRYRWYNLPSNLSSQELERLIYYKGQLCFFYLKEVDEFYFMPYALDGTIDFYGRYNTVHPVPFADGIDETNKKQQAELLSKIKLNVKYDVVTPDKITIDDFLNDCVLLHDYTKQLPQSIIPRQQINDPLLDIEADIIPYLSTTLLAGTGLKGLRVNDADQEESVRDASRALKRNALNNTPWVAITAPLEFQELTDGAITKAEDYLLTMQSIDNIRLKTHGIQNGGIFEKSAQVLNSEMQLNMAECSAQYEDGLLIRQHFCNIVNSIWGIGIWCDVAESQVMQDRDMDGDAIDDEEETQPEGEDNDSTI